MLFFYVVFIGTCRLAIEPENATGSFSSSESAIEGVVTRRPANDAPQRVPVVGVFATVCQRHFCMVQTTSSNWHT
jgi:hypothetical protein